MQVVNAALQAELDKGPTDPRVLLDLYELYESDYIPGPTGYAPADAIETFAAQEITWNSIVYRREVVSRGDIVVNFGEKTNSCSIQFSNISRYLATLAENQQIEGLLLVIRVVSPDVTTDSIVRFSGRCDKPGDIDKKRFSLSARQDFGNINQTLPPWEFSTVDPDGRVPSDPLFKGILSIAVQGTITFPRVEPSSSFFGRLFGRRQTRYYTEQWSSVDSTPYGQKRREVFGRVQLQLRPFAHADKGTHVGYLMEACNGPIFAIENIKSRTEGFGDPVCTFIPTPPAVHLGDPGGTGTNTGNTCQADLGGGQLFSHLAYIEGASTGSAADATDEPPVVTALVFGRIVPLPNGSGAYVLSGWTDNPVHIARFILTDSNFVNINEGFMEDAVNHLTALHCDSPLIDETNDEMIVIHEDDSPEAGVTFTRYPSTGILNTRTALYRNLGDTEIMPETVDGPYIPWDPADPIPPELPGATPTYTRQQLLRKRYTFNAPITDEVRAVDFLYKTVFPTFKGYLRVNKYGRYEIRSEVAADATYIRSSTSVGATSIPVLNVTPWKSGPDLLAGRILLGLGIITSEVRTVSSADYSTSGNSVSLSAGSTGGIVATASGANLSGGSTTVQASGTVTFSGTPAAGDTITITIDGIAVEYTLGAADTTSTVGVLMKDYINATPRLQPYILASWASGSPTVVTIKCLHGALNLSSALLKTHSGPISDPGSAPTIAATGSGTLAAGIYYLAYSDVLGAGLTALTPIANVTLTAGQKISVTSLPAFPAGVTERQFYLSEETGSENLRYAVTRVDTSNFTIDALPLPGAALPPSSNTTAEELIRVAMSFATNSQDIFPAWSPSTAVILNDVYLPTVLNGHKYQVTTAGTTATTEPTWPTSGTVASGTAVFTEIGSTVLAQAGLTRANIVKDSFSFPGGSKQSSVNQIKGNYRSAKDDFALVPFKVNDRAHQALVKKQYPMEIDLSGVDNFHQVERLANAALSKYREGDWFNTLTAGPSALVLEEGDIICSSDDAGGLINAATRIEELRIKPNHEVIITQARKYSTVMFRDDVGSHRIVIPSTLKLSRPRAVTNVTAAKDASNDWLVKCVAQPRPIEEPAELVCEFWASTDRANPANLKLTLPMVTGTTQACLMASTTGVWDEETATFSTTNHAFKNNVFSTSGIGAGCVGTSIQPMEQTFQRFDFELTVDPTDTAGAGLGDGTFGFGFGAALHMRADAAAPYSIPLAADCPISAELTLPTDYYDTYPEGTARLTFRTYNTTLLVLDGIDMGKNPCQIVANEVVDLLPEQRPGIKLSFLHNGNEIAAYRDYNPAGGNKHLVKIATGGADLFPLRLTMWCNSTGMFLRNVNFSGAIGHSTILARRDQVAAFGSAQSTIYVRLYQKKGRYNTADGFPVDAVFPEP